MSQQPPALHPVICVFGGTFDPVHFGHLRPAMEVSTALQAERTLMIPSATPPHRDTPGATAAQRVDMLRLAIAGVPQLSVDLREVERGGASYMVDTLASLQDEFRDAALALAVGQDVLSGLHRWHRWEEVLQRAHLAIMRRPNWTGTVAAQVHATIANRKVAPDQLGQQVAGLVTEIEVTQMGIEASHIRHLIQSGQPCHYLTPEPVVRYLRDHRLYA